MSIKEELNKPELIPSKWNRNTVADGTWLQKHTLDKLKERDDFLADAIDNLSGNTDDNLSGLSAAIDYVSGSYSSFYTNEYLQFKEDVESSAAQFDTDLQKEINDRIEKDEYHDEAIETIKNQIDTMNAATDVVDVWGTYSAFSAEWRDTYFPGGSALITNNDIIKIINDEYTEIEDNLTTGHQTYFRWVCNDPVPSGPDDGQWEYVGYTDPYYNRTEVDDKILGIENTIIDLSGTVADNYLSASTDAVSAGKNIIVTKEEGPVVGIKTKDEVEFTKVTASTAQGNSANFTTGNFTNVTATNIQGTQANYTNFSGVYITGYNDTKNLTATISGLINSAANGGSMTAIKNASGIRLNWDDDKIFPFNTSADLLNLYVSGGASEWIGFDIDSMNNALALTGNLLPILSAYLPRNWSGYNDSLFSGTSRSAQSAGSALQSFSAYSAYYSTSSNSAHNAENLGGQAPSYYLTTANLKSNNAGKISGYGTSSFVGGLTALQALNSTLTAEKIKLTSGTGIDIVPTGTDEIRISANPKLIGSAYSGYSAYNWITTKSATLSAGKGIGFVSAGPNILGITAAGRDIRSGRCIEFDTLDDITFVDLSSTVSSENLYVSGNSALWQNGDSYISARGGIVKLSMDSNQSVTYFDGMQVSHGDESTTTTWEKIINAGNGIFNEISANQLTMSGIFGGTHHSAYYTASGINLKAAGMPGPNTYISPYDVSTVVYVDNQPVTASARWYDLISGRNYVSAMGNGLPMIFSAVNTLPTTLEAGVYYLV